MQILFQLNRHLCFLLLKIQILDTHFKVYFVFFGTICNLLIPKIFQKIDISRLFQETTDSFITQLIFVRYTKISHKTDFCLIQKYFHLYRVLQKYVNIYHSECFHSRYNYYCIFIQFELIMNLDILFRKRFLLNYNNTFGNVVGQ